MRPSEQAWLLRIALCLGFAAVVGVLVYLIARGVLNISLLSLQQQLARELLTSLQSGLDQLPSADLRALRQQVQAQALRNQQFSLIAGCVSAAAVAIGSIVWFVWHRRHP